MIRLPFWRQFRPIFRGKVASFREGKFHWSFLKLHPLVRESLQVPRHSKPGNPLKLTVLSEPQSGEIFSSLQWTKAKMGKKHVGAKATMMKQTSIQQIHIPSIYIYSSLDILIFLISTGEL